MTCGQFGNSPRGIKVSVIQSGRAFIFKRIPRVVKTAGQKFYKMHFWKRLIEINSVSILLRDNSEHNHFILDEYNAFDKWEQKPETKAKLASAKKNAWEQFTKQFPNADKMQFFVQESVDEKYRISAEVFFKESAEDSSSVFGSGRKYWSQEKKTALGLIGVDGFPFQLSPLKTRKALPIPAVEFTEPAQSIAKIFNKENRIHATPDEFFTTKFRDIFQQTRLKHTTAAEAKTWLRGPNMKYWPHQLNFVVFCATQGCGISREIFDSGFSLTPQIRAFYQFHVYFTIRRILYQMGGIQNISALPGDPTFNQFNNHYDVASYKRICAEFGIDPSSDFRFTHGKNHGLGYVYVYAQGATKTGYGYPGWNKFSDEGGEAIKGNLIYYIEPDVSTQYDWFLPKTAAGLTQAGLSRINQSIEAFVYYILGAQVNVRSSILGEDGRAKEAQTEFLTLMEDAIRQPDLSASVQRYQLAVNEAKVRLNLAVCPGAWLMPARMVINTESIVGYNNKLKQAKAGMKFGINNGVNVGTKKRHCSLWMEGHQKLIRQTVIRQTRYIPIPDN